MKKNQGVKQLLKAKNCQNFLDMERISEEVSDEAKCAVTLIQGQLCTTKLGLFQEILVGFRPLYPVLIDLFSIN